MKDFFFPTVLFTERSETSKEIVNLNVSDNRKRQNHICLAGRHKQGRRERSRWAPLKAKSKGVKDQVS